MRKCVLVTGANGLVGQAVKSIKDDYNFDFIFIGNKDEFDLRNELQVQNLLEIYNPDHILHLAARVGGIGRNLNSPVQQFNDNILINTNIIKTAYEYGVEKLIAFSSVCVFPQDKIVLKEDEMHNGPPFPAHWSYAMAKRAVDVQIEAYRKQYNCNYMSVIPTNIYGEHDFYNLEDGHVVPSLIHKCFVAKKENKPLEVWGDGSSFREFIYAKDLAKICLSLLESDNLLPQRLITPGQEKTIKEVVEEISSNFNHNDIFWNKDKPNGQKRRLTDRILFDNIFPGFKYTNFEDGIKNSVEWFKQNYPNVRL